MKTDLFFNRLGFNPDLTTRQSRVDSVSIASRCRVLATLLLCLTLFIGSGNVWGAGTESFENLTSATNYGSRSWTGTNGQTGWAATNARTDQKTAGSRGLTFKASTASTITMKLTSAQQSAGFGVLTFKYTYPYSDSGKSRVLSITIGGNTYSSGTLSYTSSVATGTITVNQSLASATVTINVNNGGGRICVDEFSWTSYSAGTSVSLTKAASSNGSFTLSPTSSVTTTSSAQNVTVSCTPNTGYYVSNVTATNPATGTATVTGSGNSWNVQYSSGANGTSTISVTFSPSSTWKFKYSGDSWTEHTMTESAGVASCSISLAADSRFEFGIDDNGTFYKNNGAIITTTSGWVFNTSDNNCKIHTGPAGTYTFAINTTTKAVTVTYPEDVTHPNEHYVYFKNSDVWGTVKGYLGNSGNDNKAAAWPGSDMQATASICGETYHYAALNAMNGTYNTIIFNNGNSDYGNQTSDLSTTGSLGKYNANRDANWHDFTTYTITYAGGGGTGSMSSHTDLCPGSSQQLTANTFSKTHYTFDGWHANVNVKVGGSTITAGNKINNSVTLQDIQSNVILTAQWAANSYTVTTNLANVTPNTAFPASVTYTGTTTTALNRTLTVNTTNFSLPTSITVSMAGTGTLTQGTHYTYNNSTGAFAFNVAVTGNITITATAVAKLMSIAITTQPTKRTYFAGETFSSTGAVVTATWGDASTTIVTGSATWTPTSALSAGTSQTVTATYSGKTATTTIDVYSVTVNKVDEGGTAIADAGVTATWTVGSKALTASAGSTKYVFKNWAFSGSNNGLTISNTNSASTTVTGTPTGNVTINAVFYNPVTITWSNNGVTSTTTTAYNTKPTFPSTPESCHPTSTTFIGWASSPWDGTLDDVSDKTIHTTNSSMSAATSATTYYAVFAKVSGTPGIRIEINPTNSNLPAAATYANDNTEFAIGDYTFYHYNWCKSANPPSAYNIQAKKDIDFSVYNETEFTGYIDKIVVKQTGTNRAVSIVGSNYYDEEEAEEAGDTYESHNFTTTTGATMTFSFSGYDYGYFALKTPGNAVYMDSVVIYTRSSYSAEAYLTTCCENIVELSTGTLSHCTMSISPTNLQTCSGTATDRQVTITVTPDAGYEMTSEASLTFTKSSGTATATYVSGPTGSGTYTFVYQFNQNDNGAGTFDATCTPKTYTISLNDQTPTTAASPSSITATFDSNTGLTGTVVTTLPTKTGYTFGGYYTATGGGGVQIITDAGVVVANAGTGSYTDASKNWKYADDLTIYASWIAKSWTNYRTTCGVEITVSGSVWLTSYANVAVYTTNSPNNLITVTCTDFGSATRLGVKYIHNGDAVAKTSSPFRLCYYGFPGKTNYNKADGDGTAGGYDYINLSSDAKTAIASGQTFAIEYTPAADEYDQEDTYTIRLAALDGSTDKGYVDFTVHGRALPEQFVIASKVGDQWYALPNTILDNKRAIEPIEITVDNTTTPTRATNAPNTTAYQGTGRYASGTNRYGIRLADPSGHWLQVSSSSGTNYVWVSGTGSSTCQDWNLSSTDFGAYTLTVPSSGAEDKKMGIKSGNMGYYASPDDPSQQIYLLPADFYTEAEAQILKWKANSVIVMYTGTETSSTTKVGSNSASSAQTLSSQKLTHGIYELTTAQSLASNDGKTLLLGFGDTKKAFDIPLIINSDVTATSGHDKQDVVIVNGGKLTAAATKYSFRNVYVYGGGKLAIPSGTSLGTNDIILRAGGISTNGSGGSATYEYVYPQFSLIGTLTNSSGKFRYEYVTDYDHWYQLCLPFNATLSSITYPQEYYGDNVTAANTGSWVIKRYAGEVRATGSYDAWKDIEKDSPAKTEVTAGQGYIFWGAPKKVTINGDKQRQAWGIQRMTMTIAAGAATTAETNDKNISVDSYSDVEGKSTKPNDQGWNLVGNPYMVNLTDWSSESMIAGQLVPTETVPWDGKWRNNGDGIRYVTIPDNHFDSYVAKTASVAAGAGDFMPGRAFFVQIAEGATTLTFAATNRASLMPALRAKTEVSIDVETGIVMSDESKQDEMNFWIKDGKTAEYEVNADYPKTMNGTNFNIYGVHSHGDLSWIAISPEIAEGSMPIGYQVPGEGEYMLSLSETYVSDKIEHMFVTDHAMNPEVTVDLMDGSYEFTVNQAETNNERFTISIKLKEDNPDILTGVESLDLDIERPIKFIYQDKLYILRGGVIYDATGKRVQEVNK